MKGVGMFLVLYLVYAAFRWFPPPSAPPCGRAAHPERSEPRISLAPAIQGAPVGDLEPPRGGAQLSL